MGRLIRMLKQSTNLFSFSRWQTDANSIDLVGTNRLRTHFIYCEIKCYGSLAFNETIIHGVVQHWFKHRCKWQYAFVWHFIWKVEVKFRSFSSIPTVFCISPNYPSSLVSVWKINAVFFSSLIFRNEMASRWFPKKKNGTASSGTCQCLSKWFDFVPPTVDVIYIWK